MKNLIKSVILVCVCFVFCGEAALAKIVPITASAPAPFTGPFPKQVLTVFDNTPQTNVINRSIMDGVSLRVVDNIAITSNFSYKVTVLIDYYATASSLTPFSSKTETLAVNYNTAAGAANTYQRVDTRNTTGALKIVVTVQSADVKNPGDNLPGAGMVQLTGTVSVDRAYNFNVHDPVLVNSYQINSTKQLPLSWTTVTGAHEYDVEWTTIAEGDANESIAAAMLANTGAAAQGEPIFKNNASRMTTSAEAYTISLAYNDKYLLARIRAVQYTADGIRVAGDWTYKDAASPTSHFLIWDLTSYWHEPALNWQYSEAFAEEGRKKEVISYFDGTLRNRQTVTLNNSQNVPLVQENIYDLFGRQTASILPAPAKEQINGVWTNVPYLHYFQKLNVNTSATPAPYTYRDVIGTGSVNCEFIPAPLSAGKGTSKYYSTGNDFLNDPLYSAFAANAKYIPDAQQYPLSVTQYTADNTGRIKLQGGVGPAFQPGGVPGNTTKYYYGKPEQWELDQLFGNEVGYAEHYTKNMVVDANNQISISYQNASGKTIATALAGGAPTGMDALPSMPTSQQQVSKVLKPEQFVFDNASVKLSGTTTYLAAVTGPVHFTFDMQKLIYTYSQGSTQICSSCYYDMNVKVVNSCAPNTPLTLTGITLPLAVGAKGSVSCTPGSQTGSFDANFNAIGEYYITVEFAMNRQSIEDYVDQWLTSAQTNKLLNTEWTYLQAQLAAIDFNGLLGDCRTALQVLGTKAAFTQMFNDKLAANGIVISSYATADQTSYNNWVSSKYDALLAQAQAATTACDFSPCADTQALMEKDVAPGGQYSLFDDQNKPLETDINIINDNWRRVFPVIQDVNDPVYQSHYFTKDDGKVSSANDGSTSLADLVKYWNDSWNGLFLQYHPEYCKLLFCQANSSNKDWDERVKQLAVKFTDIPSIKGAPNGFTYSYTNGAWLFAVDPFFADGGPASIALVPGTSTTIKQAMLNDLNNYSSSVLHYSTPGAVVKNLSQYIDYELYCSGNCSTGDSQSNNCWNNCSAAACRVPDRDWSQYKAFYFQLKDVYYDMLRKQVSCADACDIGTPYTVPLATANCPEVGDFTISRATEFDPAPSGTGTNPCGQAVTITYNKGNLLNNTYLYLYYGSGVDVTNAPPSITMAGGTSKTTFCLPATVPLGAVKIRVVNCTGVAPAPPGTPTRRTPYDGYVQAPPKSIDYSGPKTGNDFYISGISYEPQGNDPIYWTKVRVAVSPDIPYCIRNGMVVTLINDEPRNIFRNYWYRISIDANSDVGVARVPTQYFKVGAHGGFLGLFETPEYTTGRWNVYGSVTDCATPAPPPAGGCSYNYPTKTSRFDIISRTNNFPTTKDGPNGSDAQNNALIAIQIQNSCEGNSVAWIRTLSTGLSVYPQAKIDALTAALIQFCAGNGDSTHPFGASTSKTGSSPKDFGEVIKNTLTYSGSPFAGFTPTLNPWLLNGPGSYAKPTQAANYNVSNSSAAIAAVLAQFEAARVAAAYSGTLYQYLVSKFGTAMTLSQTEFSILQNASAGCNYVLSQDLTLPVFLQPGATGCITASDFATARSELVGNFPGGLTTASPNYQLILTNFMNQKFGFSLGYSTYATYDASPSGMLCNVPAFIPVTPDPYVDIKANIGVAASTARQLYKVYIDEQKALFRANYIATCAAAKANLNATANKQNYHYTLYYYDQADNLVRTIPPEGVSLLNAAQIQQVQQVRDGGDAGSCGSGYTGPTTTNLSGELADLSTALSSNTNAAAEFWLYSPFTSKYQYAQSTTNGQYQLQISVDGPILSADVFSAPSNGTFTRANHVSVNLAALVQFQQWTHVVVQSSSLLNGPLSVYVNGSKAPVIAGASSALPASDITVLKHARFYTRLLTPSEIMVNAANNCFMPVNTDGHWYRFNIPAAGSETTIGPTSQLETKLNGIYPNHVLATSYTYNASNQVSQQNSPDGGTNSFWYDRKSRLIASQNDKQLAGQKFSYTKYDELGRISEVGEKTASSAGIGVANYLDDYTIGNFYNTGTDAQITATFYDQPASGLTGLATTITQNNLRKRVSASTYRDNKTDAVQQATYYNYDLDGNVNTLWQQINGLGLKQVDYEYDLVSGKVNFVRYQAGQTDEFFYKYDYDAENRLTDASSSTTAMIRPYQGSELLLENKRKDAHYSYYLHGPLARMTLGDDAGYVQGLDYAYTLQGWLKGVNSQNTASTDDIGLDGMTGNNQTVARDALAYSLGYYNGTFKDYQPIGGSGSTAFGLQYTAQAGDITGQSLYNGNISNTTMSLSALNSGAPVGYTYHYDQLNRIKNMRQHNSIIGGTWNSSSITPDFQENMTYDGNGNILTFFRNGAGGLAMDNLTYRYNKDPNGRLKNNQLAYVNDAVNSSYTSDIDNQSAGNYTYDQIGNLNKDVQSSITNIDWTVYGKIKQISKASGNIIYTYDAAGNRASKSVGGLTTWYVRDGQGNPLAVYDNASSAVNWREQQLYGTSRLGTWTPNVNLNTATATAGDDAYGIAGRKYYELTNHLGNVMATVSDRRIQQGATPSFLPDVISAQDYSPFGKLQPGTGKQYLAGSAANYRYGFNGKENDNDVGKDIGNEQDYGMRIYDPRLGRFLSVDPISKSYPELTPYQFASNTPIRAIDIDGLEAAVYMDPRNNIAEDIRSLIDNSKKAVIGYVTRIENTHEGLMRTYEYATGQPPSFRMKVKMGFSAFMMNSKEANHLVNPAQIGIDAYKDYKGGHYVLGTLGVLAIIPGLEELKLSKYAKFGKCTEFAAEFFSKYNKAITKAGGTVEKFEINLGKNTFIGTAEKQLADNGMHQFIEVTKDGKTVIFDNLHPQGIAKEEYVKSIEGAVINKNGTVTVIPGSKLLENYTKKVK
ncbi:RHS repeat-associated core domain-containing protein [Mucilaginibacter sp. R-33]|uniref:RHS repeat-associated core domain-containing protein n=1 Tax=Mucilaginibacter sp. R-33 TaxID=3416711 RepID=UPI003CE9A3A7